MRSPTTRSTNLQSSSHKVRGGKKKQQGKHHSSSARTNNNNHRGNGGQQHKNARRRPSRPAAAAVAALPTTSSTTTRIKDVLCGCKRIVLAVASFVLLCIAGGILLWQFLPTKAQQAVQAVYDNGAPLVGTGILLEDEGPPPPTFVFDDDQCNTNTTTTAAGGGGSSSRQCCNGIPGLCNLRANEIAYAGVHNAQANLADGFLVAPNHRYGILGALEYGYRVVNLDMGVCDGTLVLFHGFCRLGTTDILQTFLEINEWLTEHPTEVVMFPIQIDNSGDGTVNLRHLYSVLEFAGNFTERMVALPTDLSEPWPTLGELVASDQRVLFFHYNSAGCDTDNCPNTLHNWFMYAAETDYANVDETDFEDPDACAVTRGLVTAPLFALNVFVEIPSQALSGEVLNRRPFLEQQMEKCSANGEMDVNVIFVDYWFESDLPAVVQDHNRKLVQQQQQGRGRFLRRMIGG